MQPAYHLPVEDFKTRINAIECGSVVNKEDITYIYAQLDVT
jgi:hypothetical protein